MRKTIPTKLIENGVYIETLPSCSSAYDSDIYTAGYKNVVNTNPTMKFVVQQPEIRAMLATTLLE